MTDIKKNMLLVVEAQANEDACRLSTELMAAEPGEAEAIRAGLEFEQWLAASCRQRIQHAD